MIKIDQTTSFPFTLPVNAFIENNTIVDGGCINGVYRAIIPYFASEQDRVITAFFLRHVKEEISACVSERSLAIVRLSQEYLNRRLYRGCSVTQLSKDIVELERYVIAARLALGDFSSNDELVRQKLICKQHCYRLFRKWERCGHAEDAFWKAPDLVDLIMRTSVHKIMRHPAYNHKIETQWCAVMRGEETAFEQQPHILLQGELTPWTQVRSQFLKDERNRIYSVDEEGNKTYWNYFQEGLIPWDKYAWNIPHPFTTVPSPPEECEVQIVTTHAKADEWTISDRYLRGTRHTFLRVVFRKDFEIDHPDSTFRQGQMYSFGFGYNGKDSSKMAPLATVRGRWVSPDYAEYEKDDLCVTRLALSDAKALELMDSIVQRALDPAVFHVMHPNCASEVMNLLEDVRVLRIPIRTHLLNMYYKFLVPELLRNPLNKIGDFLHSILPSLATRTIRDLTLVSHSLLVTPIFLAMGACWTRYDEDGFVQPFFSRWFDCLNPEKMTLAETIEIFNWQQSQLQTNFERH